MRELRERLEEVESSGSRRMKAQLQAMDGKISTLEEELDSAQKYVLYNYDTINNDTKTPKR